MIYVQQHSIKLSFRGIVVHMPHIYLIWKTFRIPCTERVNIPTLVEMKKYTQGKIVTTYFVT